MKNILEIRVKFMTNQITRRNKKLENVYTHTHIYKRFLN